MKLKLAHLSTELLKFHRQLLMFQTSLAEKSDNVKYTPYDLLKLSLNDSRFQWLKKFSDVIIQIDIIIDDKKNTHFDPWDIVKASKNLISTEADTNEDFKFALKSDSSLMMSLGSVRVAISELEKTIKSESN